MFLYNKCNHQSKILNGKFHLFGIPMTVFSWIIKSVNNIKAWADFNVFKASALLDHRVSHIPLYFVARQEPLYVFNQPVLASFGTFMHFCRITTGKWNILHNVKIANYRKLKWSEYSQIQAMCIAVHIMGFLVFLLDYVCENQKVYLHSPIITPISHCVGYNPIFMQYIHYFCRQSLSSCWICLSKSNEGLFDTQIAFIINAYTTQRNLF